MRKTWNDYWFDVADMVSTRATCPRLHVGAVIVRDNRILSTGYNGSMPGASHCEDVGCLLVDNHCERTIHAEINAYYNVPKELAHLLPGSMLFCTHTPCSNCAPFLIDKGVIMVWRHEYP